MECPTLRGWRGTGDYVKREIMPTLAPALVQGMVAAVQGVSFGLLLLPSSEPVFAAHTTVATTAWMLSACLGQLAVVATSRLPCAVAGGAIELLPLGQSVAMAVARAMPLDKYSEDEVVSTALGGMGFLSLVIAAWYHTVHRYALHSYLRFFPLSALKGALAGVGVYLMRETWGAVNHDVIQLVTAVAIALGMVVGERWVGGPWFLAAYLILAAGVVCFLKSDDPNWLVTGGSGSSDESPEIWRYWDARFLKGAPAPWRVRWGVLLASPAIWTAAAGGAFIHQLSTAMDLINLQSLGARPRTGGGVVESEVPTLSLENALAAVTLTFPNYLPFSCCYAVYRATGNVASSSSETTARVVDEQDETARVLPDDSSENDDEEAAGSTATPVDDGNPFWSPRREGRAEIAAAATASLRAKLQHRKLAAAQRRAKIEASRARKKNSTSGQKKKFAPEPLSVAVLCALLGAAVSLDAVAAKAPRAVAAAYFLFLGTLFVEETVVKTVFFERPHLSDRIVVCLMPLATSFLGFVEGLLMGLVIASLCLVARIGSTPGAAAVRTVLNGESLLTNAHRDPRRDHFLRTWGRRRVVLVLQGLVSFATAPAVLDTAASELDAAVAEDGAVTVTKIKNTSPRAVPRKKPASSSSSNAAEKEKKPPRLALVVRCALVSSLDYTAARAFLELRRLCASRNADLVVVELDAKSLDVLSRLGFFAADDGRPPRVFEHFLAALEHVEDAQLADSGLDLGYPRPYARLQSRETKIDVLTRCLGEHLERNDLDPGTAETTTSDDRQRLVAALAAAFEPRFIDAEEVVYTQGASSEAGMFLIVRGELQTQRLDAAGRPRVIEIVKDMALVGYLSAVTNAPRHCTLVAAKYSECLQLDRAHFDDLQRSEPDAAMLLVRALLARSNDEYEHHIAFAADMAT